MRNTIICTILGLMPLVSCMEYDEVAMWNKNESIGSRLEELEALCDRMNTNITSIQQIIGSLQDNDYVTGVAPVTENGKIIGYTITFSKSGPVTIYHGEKGDDGKIPSIGVKAADDGIYYWTVDGEWLTDSDGNKIAAIGQDGDSGITPILEIKDDGYWYISYDNGDSWVQLGPSTGEPGDSMFSGIDTSNPDYLILTLAGTGETIMLPYYKEALDLLFISGEDRLKEMQIYCGAGTAVEVEYELTARPDADVAIECISHSTYTATVDMETDRIIISAPDNGSGTDAVILVFASDDDRTIMRKLTVKPVNYITYVATAPLGIENTSGHARFWGNDCTFLPEFDTYDQASGEGKWAYIGTVEHIEPSAFNGETSLVSLSIPEGVVYIGGNAFNRSSLQEVVLPESLVSIDQYAFSKTSLKEITIPANVEELGSSAFEHELNGNSLLSKVVFEGNKIKTIKTGTFKYCSALASIQLPDGLLTIEYNAFDTCSSLTEIVIPDSVTEIGNAAFCFCTDLTDATIGDGVTKIGERAFSECTALKRVTIGRGIREIGDMAFNTKNSRDQMSLEKVTVLFDDISSGEFPVLKSGSRGVFPKPGGWDTVSYKIYVPSGTGAAYKSHWTDYSSLIVEDSSL